MRGELWLIRLWDNFKHGIVLCWFEAWPGARAAKIEEMGKQLHAQIAAYEASHKPVQGMELVSYDGLE